MNPRQLACVALGLLIFTAGAVLGLRPVELLRDGVVSVASPLLDPVEVLAVRPGPVLLALLVTLAGLAVALGGCWIARSRR